MVVNGERSRSDARCRTGFIGGNAGSQGFADPTQIAESEAKIIAQEKENDVEKNAYAVEEEEEESENVAESIGKKEIKSIADSVTGKVGIADTSSIVAATHSTIADTAVCDDPSSNRSAGTFTRGNSASRGREVWISR